MGQLAITDELAATLVRRRPGRRTYRTDWMPLADFVACLDLAEAKKILRRTYRREKPDHRDGWKFRDAFNERFPDLAYVDVLIERTEVPMKLGAGGLYLRSFADMARDKRCAKPNIELGKRMWERLTEEWVDPRDLGVGQDDVTAAEMGMWKLKLPVEQSGVRYQYGFWVAYSLAQGEEITGGTHFNEIRRKPGSRR